MGILKAAFGAAQGAMEDQWIDYFYCDAMTAGILACQGIKATGNRSTNTSQNELITQGSIIAVNDGQCAVIVENGKVIEVFTQPGENKVTSESAPSVFSGNARGVLKDIGRRFTYGGDAPPVRQRVYYINTRPVLNNPFETPAGGVPVRIRSYQIGMDVDMNVRCAGVYSFKIADPAVFYRRVCANFSGLVLYQDMENHMKNEVKSAVAKALVSVNENGVRLSMLPQYVEILEQAMITELNRQWGSLRGIEIDSLAISALDVSERDSRMVQTHQRDGMFLGAGVADEAKTYQPNNPPAQTQKPNIPSVQTYQTSTPAVRTAQTSAPQTYTPKVNVPPVVTPKVNIPPVRIPPAASQTQASTKPAPTAALTLWTCSCGARNRGKFCTECGRPKVQKID